jgi:hypothetical protein
MVALYVANYYAYVVMLLLCCRSFLMRYKPPHLAVLVGRFHRDVTSATRTHTILLDTPGTSTVIICSTSAASKKSNRWRPNLRVRLERRSNPSITTSRRHVQATPRQVIRVTLVHRALGVTSTAGGHATRQTRFHRSLNPRLRCSRPTLSTVCSRSSPHRSHRSDHSHRPSMIDSRHLRRTRHHRYRHSRVDVRVHDCSQAAMELTRPYSDRNSDWPHSTY